MNNIAKTIYEQLGAGRFVAMTGAKDFCAGSNSLQFRIGRGARNGINVVRITLDTSDTYIMECWSMRNLTTKPRGRVDMIYADRLQATFTELTGLDTHL